MAKVRYLQPQNNILFLKHHIELLGPHLAPNDANIFNKSPHWATLKYKKKGAKLNLLAPIRSHLAIWVTWRQVAVLWQMEFIHLK